MVQYDPERPEIARELQDVESPPQRVEEAPHQRDGVGSAFSFRPRVDGIGDLTGNYSRWCCECVRSDSRGREEGPRAGRGKSATGSDRIEGSIEGCQAGQ